MEEEDFEKQETGAAVTRCVEVTGGGKASWMWASPALGEEG
jgi:hypothetical protein